ncbi:alpha-N-acetylgalactosaminide alpha-2,6-sialyltransferase 2-like isoform X1 [Alligator sinensis]|uniref:alpha-N-acetylgalactosaminide alpha-2,6-sialyltransferase n=2 Tax=Alligator sinensis TaxID=38654 RepID=A0A3Q0HL46_ALLSI|nr:alpha-N-acetylgalactosaminide alpha-2,6-sialyltransferase 2-like isoform X1 [Alligator sinensis]
MRLVSRWGQHPMPTFPGADGLRLHPTRRAAMRWLRAVVSPRSWPHACSSWRPRACLCSLPMLGLMACTALLVLVVCWGSSLHLFHRYRPDALEPEASTRTVSPPRPMLESFLGDQYGQDGTYQSSGCPSSIRKRIHGTEFSSIFLETIPVLQWSRHAEEAEYQRLQRYHGAFGWQEVSWPVLRDALSLLNTSANARLLEARGPGDPSCIRCAVVGTGGILNSSGMGAAINRHDYVFRMNGAITAGFERDVGDRTSFYGFSTNTMMNALHAYAANGFQQPPRTPETRYLFLPDHDRDYLLLRAAMTRSPVDQGQDKGARPQQYFGEDLRAEKFKMLHPDFIRYLRNRFLLSETVRSLRWKLYRPSTGAVMLLTAMHTCDEVSAYGFLTPNYAAFSEHYYDRVHKSISFYLNHDMQLELQLWQRLQRSGLLTLYTRD